MKVFNGLFERILIGIFPACYSLDDEAAQSMIKSISNVNESLKILNTTDLNEEWNKILLKLEGNDNNIHGLVRGFCIRILLEQKCLTEEDLERKAHLNLSFANPISQVVSWIEGLLTGIGLFLIHQDGFWSVMNSWVIELNEDIFSNILPILRRAFSNFSRPERRNMGEKIKHIQISSKKAKKDVQKLDFLSIDEKRANKVLNILTQILGVKHG
ncbi:MAG: hypothetical protein HQK76_05505 [Desulfobacterales bacterium]|nr:hypothetical protein [Desulfobacterales bacterium]